MSRKLEGAVSALWRVALATALTVAPLAATAYEAGMRTLPVLSEARGVELEVTLWYPTEGGGTPAMTGESIFFEGTPALADAPVAEGRFPLIVLSHGAGLGGTAEAMSWIAAPLAEAGFVVAAPTHPFNTGRDRSAEETMKLWLRPVDLTATLDAVSKDTVFGDNLKPDATGVLGLSMGGNSALLLAGARLDPEAWAGYCDTMERNPSLCGWVRMSGVDLHAMDSAAAGADYGDDRVRFAMAIDPALSDVIAPDSLSAVDVPVMLVNLGKESPATVDAKGIAAALPQADYVVVENAGHDSMFGLCQPGAADIAQEEGIEDPICSDGGSGRPRAAIHAELVGMTVAAFGAQLRGE